MKHKMLRGTLGKALQNTGTGKNFLEKRLLTAQEVNPRICKWDSMKLKGIGTLSTVQRQATEWVKISNSYVSDGSTCLEYIKNYRN